jgi:multiple sugar transport system permease protein
MAYQDRKNTAHYVIVVLLIVITCIYLFPTVWMIMTSLKTRLDSWAIPPKIFFKPILDNYDNVFFRVTGGERVFSELARHMLNSFVIAGASTFLAVALGTLSAYAFSRFKIPAKDDLLFFILSTRMMPPVVIVIPVFLVFSTFYLMDSFRGMILLYTAFNLGFAVWMMKGFIDEIPREYEEAALCDGYTRFQVFLKIVLPQSVTGMAATAVFCLIVAWNEFVLSLILTSTVARTAPPAVASNVLRMSGTNWGVMSASGFVLFLPVLIFTFLVRNHLLAGVTFGAIRK